MIDLQSFRDWQLQGRRSVKIEMGTVDNPEHFTVWVYDYDLQVGQYVTSVEEIDLIRKAEKDAVEQYERLQKILQAKKQVV